MKTKRIKEIIRKSSHIMYEITFKIPEMNGKKSRLWTGTVDETIEALELAGCTNIKIVQSL